MGVVAFCDGVKAAANVLEQVSSMPVKYIQRLQQDVRAVGASIFEGLGQNLLFGHMENFLVDLLGGLAVQRPDYIRAIRSDFPRISGVFSVNCLFRYKLFTENGYMQEYLRDMSTLVVIP